MLADTPLLVLLVLAIGLPLAAEAGSRLTKVGADEEDKAAALSAAMMGLVALLVAFTFGMAASRFDSRRAVQVQEANAIGTVYLRYQLLDEPHRTTLLADMAPYAATRLAFAAAGEDRRALSRNAAATSALQTRIWNDLAQALRTPQGAALSVSLLQATNDMIDITTTRQAVTSARIPGAVRWALVLFAILGAASVGWSNSSNWRRRRAPAGLLFLLLALAITLIADLDQPGAGLIRVPQGAMQATVGQILQGHTAGFRTPAPAAAAPVS